MKPSEGDLLDAMAASSGYVAESAETTVNRQQSLDLMERALQKLPARQLRSLLAALLGRVGCSRDGAGDGLFGR